MKCLKNMPVGLCDIQFWRKGVPLHELLTCLNFIGVQDVLDVLLGFKIVVTNVLRLSVAGLVFEDRL